MIQKQFFHTLRKHRKTFAGAKVQQKNDMCKKMPIFLSKRTRREGERIVRAKRDKNSPIAEIGHERAKWATATDGVKYPKNIPADESYLDEQPSYASNEVAINWNVTLFALSAGIDALQ